MIFLDGPVELFSFKHLLSFKEREERFKDESETGRASSATLGPEDTGPGNSSVSSVPERMKPLLFNLVRNSCVKLNPEHCF